ncbi:hypothetical protein JCM10908_000631 [Rhodotorula pacifica]|uniref:FUN14 domain-containing protein n=1 Tax=Rhodotorula pacifica TaxID=1495444 RepID=UPI0031766793
MLSARWPTPLAALRHAATPSKRVTLSPSPWSTSIPHFSSSSSRFGLRNICSTTTRTHSTGSTTFLHSYRWAVALAFPVGALTVGALGGGSAPHKQPLQCASAERAYATAPPPLLSADATTEDLTEAESILNIRDLSFGTVSGICVGVFVKKGLRALAFALGGVFVLLQYLSSRNFVTVDWGAITRSYDSNITSRLGRPAAKGGNRLQGLGAWFIDFVGANIQSRATFVLGVMLGLRLG